MFQARILEWVAIFYSGGSSWSRNQTYVPCTSCLGRWIPFHCATWETICVWERERGRERVIMRNIIMEVSKSQTCHLQTGKSGKSEAWFNLCSKVWERGKPMVSASIQGQKTNITAQAVIGALKAIYKDELTALSASAYLLKGVSVFSGPV